MAEASSSVKLLLYTDGSAHLATKCGGWAYCIVRGRRLIRSESGAESATTVNRMELQAAIEALRFAGRSALLRRGESLHLNSDSKYVVDYLVEDRRHIWPATGFTNAYGEPVKNQDLWQQVEQALVALEARGVTVFFHWVRGHNGNYFNEQCDMLAGEARTRHERQAGVQRVPRATPAAGKKSVSAVSVRSGKNTGRPASELPSVESQRQAAGCSF